MKCSPQRSLNKQNVQMQVLLPLFLRFPLMISGARKIPESQGNAEAESEQDQKKDLKIP